MLDLLVTMGEYPCGSWDITVGSRVLQITDARRVGGAPQLHIVQIGNAETSLNAAATRSQRLRSSGSQTLNPASKWSKVCLLAVAVKGINDVGTYGR